MTNTEVTPPPTPAKLDEQIAQLQARRDELAAKRTEADQAFAVATLALHDSIDESATDLEVVRDLPEKLKTYITACREYHRVVTGQILRRRKNFAVAGPDANLNDPAFD